jgi:hypothetical protein
MVHRTSLGSSQIGGIAGRWKMPRSALRPSHPLTAVLHTWTRDLCAVLRKPHLPGNRGYLELE